MTHVTCFTVRVECWGFGNWSAHTKDKRASRQIFGANNRESPVAALRALADEIEIHTANGAFLPQSKHPPESSANLEPVLTIHDYDVERLDLKTGVVKLSRRHDIDIVEDVLLRIPDEILQQAKLSLISD